MKSAMTLFFHATPISLGVGVLDCVAVVVLFNALAGRVGEKRAKRGGDSSADLDNATLRAE